MKSAAMHADSAIIENAEDLAMLVPVRRLNKDLLSASTLLTDAEARFMVDAYYQKQEDRKRADNQIGALDRENSAEPHTVVDWFAEQSATLEKQILRALDRYTQSKEIGKWAHSIVGIGPVISAGLMAHIDITQVETAGQIWRFAGLDPTSRWVGREESAAWVSEWVETHANRTKLENKSGKRAKGDIDPQILRDAAAQFNKRFATLEKFAIEYSAKEGKLTASGVARSLSRLPWNAALKTLSWKIGESFVKVCNHKDDFYGHLYTERKEQEHAKNEAGEFAAQAADKLKKYKIGKITDAYAYYSVGKLPPAHIHSRAKRYAVKIFLSHYFEAAYRFHYRKEPPAPFPIAILGHAHRIRVPGLMVPEGQ